MDIVVDASVIIAVIANEPEKAALIKVTKGADLIAPHSIHWEIGNAFSAMLKRKRITLEDAQKAIEAYGHIPIRFVDVGLVETLQVADKLGIYAYDAYLIRCALKYKCALVTLDQSLIAHAREMKAQVMEVSQ